MKIRLALLIIVVGLMCIGFAEAKNTDPYKVVTPISFGFGDMFSNFFGGGTQFGGFSGSGGSRHGNKRSIPSVNFQCYRREIVDKGMTWLLFVYTSNLRGIEYYESVIDEVATSLQGALKVGSVNCEHDASFCKELVYSYASSENGSLLRV